MNKRVLRTAIATAWAMLLFSFISKLCGSKAFEIVAVNERFVTICNWLDNDGEIAKYALMFVMYYVSTIFIILASSLKIKLSGKEFTFAEFYATAIMLYTDFRKVLGGGNIDLYVRLAQAWLMDDDIDIDAGEKLCAYYESIVNA